MEGNRGKVTPSIWASSMFVIPVRDANEINVAVGKPLRNVNPVPRSTRVHAEGFGPTKNRDRRFMLREEPADLSCLLAEHP